MHADGDESICSFMPVAQRPPICVPSGLVLWNYILLYLFIAYNAGDTINGAVGLKHNTINPTFTHSVPVFKTIKLVWSAKDANWTVLPYINRYKPLKKSLKQRKQTEENQDKIPGAVVRVYSLTNRDGGQNSKPLRLRWVARLPRTVCCGENTVRTIRAFVLVFASVPFCGRGIVPRERTGDEKE